MKINAPLYESLVDHYKQSCAAFHIPGHKSGRSFNPSGAEFYSELLKIDLTELSGLDDLHQPTETISEAEILAAELFCADQTFFLVNGTTVGNLAIVLATCNAGDKLIIERNVHKSVINGLLLARAKPVIVDSEINEKLGVATGVSFSALREALIANPDAKGVLITNPNYYGMNIDIARISMLVHQYEIPLLVDEAHGAHYGFHLDFPQSAMQQGADVAVQSTHKMLCAMGMGSMLHLRGELVDAERISFYLAMLESSSPSYPIMASLDLTRAWIEEEGSNLWNDVLRELMLFKKRLQNRLNNIEIVGGLLVKGLKLDPLKLTIHIKNGTVCGVTGIPFTGRELRKQLESRHIYIELAELRNVLCVFSAGTTANELDLLAETLLEIDSQLVAGDAGFINLPVWNMNTSGNFTDSLELFDLSNILEHEQESIPLNSACDRIAASMITPYPPGVPVIQLGEKFSVEMIEYLEQLLLADISIHGVKQIGGLSYVRVLA